MPNQGVESRVAGGGSPPKPFREVDANYRGRLSNEVTAIRSSLLPQLRRVGSVPIRVKLMTRAIAKSHRPEQLFSSESCPIIGAGRLGELFVKATSDGLDSLARMIREGQSDRLVKELSTIETIEPITPAFRRRGLEPVEIVRQSPRGTRGFITRVRLFNYGDDDQERLLRDFETSCAEVGVEMSRRGYSASSWIYSVECRSADEVDRLSRVVGVRSISGMPLVKVIRPQLLNSAMRPKLPSRDPAGGDIPVVVVVDSGVTGDIPELESWVVGRESTVAPEYRNTEHGTFVAGLVCWGSELNPTLSGLEASPCGVFDLQVLPNGDPSKGDTQGLLESELLVSLDAALKAHANEYRVWNLSLGLDAVCSLDEFSDLAEQLDNLQETYQVSFVISAGNYSTPPLLDFPRAAHQLDVGRITAPADSVLGITVGSVSHVDYKDRGPKLNQPSAFSRHGSGPNYVIKPDLVHYGGACASDLGHVSGIRSLDAGGVAEDCGTSFSAPLVARTLAEIYHQITPAPSPVLARALLTHHARDPRTGARVPDGDENFFGFGRPAPVPYSLECTPNSSTLVFDDVLRPGYYLEWDNFPYPASLHARGRFFGEIWMTVAFAPARGGRWGTEYCETHVDAHLGVYRDHVNTKTGEIRSKFHGLVPPEHRNPGALYESYQVEKLRKWAPVRTYYGNLGTTGERGQRWRLMLRLLTRHGIEDAAAFTPQPFSLIVTISDPEAKAPVYDEMAQLIRSRFQAQDLAIRARTRIRAAS